MDKLQMWKTECNDLDATASLGVSLGKRLQGGEVIELSSDVGGGKTTFVRSLVAGMGSHDLVTSPSFTLSNVYKTDKLNLYHFDFYRLIDPGIMRNELAEVVVDPLAVTVVEWAGIVESVLPAKHLKISISVSGEMSRSFEFRYPDSYSYLFPELGS